MQLVVSSTSNSIVTNLTTPFIKSPKEFLSNDDAVTFLKSKKWEYKEIPETSFDANWKIVAVAVFLFSILGATLALLDISNKKAHIDHSNDNTTSYQFINSPFGLPLEFYDKYLPTKDYFWVDHTRDKWIPDLQESLKAFFPIAIVPTLVIIIAWKVYEFSSKELVKPDNKMAADQNKKLNDLILSFQVSKLISKDASLDTSLVRPLLDLNLNTSDLLKNLSFSQIRKIRADRPSLFNTMLDEKQFSSTQQLYWSKFDKMLKADTLALSKALMHSSNNKIIEDEPRFLEALIQELTPDQLTEDIKKIFANKIRAINEQLLKIEKEEAIQIVDLVHNQKHRIEKAYQVYNSGLIKDDKKISFKIIGEDGSIGHSKPVSLNHLCSKSPVFKRMLQGEFMESHSEEIQLNDIEIQSFNAVLEYLETDVIDKNKDILNYLELANRFGIDDLHLFIETIMCKDLNEYVEDHELETLLELCKDYNLNLFKKAIDLKVSLDLPLVFSEEYKELIEIAAKHSLDNVLKGYAEIISGDIAKLSEDDHFIQKLVEIAKINYQLFENVFVAFTIVLHQKPKLLGALWEETLKHKVEKVLDHITEFNKQLENADIFLANWALPPSKEKKEFILNSMELKEFI